MIDVWINKESGWNIASIESQYINIPTYRPLAVSSSIDLPVELKSPRKGLLNIKNKDEIFFFGVMLDILIFQKIIQKELEKVKKKIAEKLDYDRIEFPVQEKDFNKTEVKNSNTLMCLVMKMG